MVYRDKGRIAYAKRVQIQRFIRDKEYHLIKDKAGKVDLLLPGDAAGELQIKFVPAKRQRVKESAFDMAELEFSGVAARGTRIAPKPVSRIKWVNGKG